MNITEETLRAEAKKYRSLAARFESLADDMAGKSPQGGTFEIGGFTRQPAVPRSLGEYTGMTQTAAILKAIKSFGPQTTRELFTRLNAGGQSFKQVSYVTAVIARMKDDVVRTDEGRIRLKAM